MSRPFASSLLALVCAGGLGLPAEAGEHAEAPVAKPAAAASAAQRAEPKGDPLDQLRAKLAERLGAIKAPESRNPNVLRVANKAAAEPASATGHGLPRPVAPAGRPAEASTAPAAGHAAPHWSYEGENGPQAWGRMKPEFDKCATGTRQSPIDIRSGFQVQLPAIEFDYRPGNFSVIDNGHTVQVNLPPGNALTVLGRRYELLQFHFHRPSEERVNGRQFDMVVHLVHKDAQGKLAVVAVLLERGSAQPLIQAVWNALPLEKGEDVAAPVTIDPRQLLPEDPRYYTYMGSLTTPPCSEGVLWMVMKQPVHLSPEQLAIFARLYPMNARPVQATSERMIKESE
jgi:carbonic anhydrase